MFIEGLTPEPIRNQVHQGPQRMQQEAKLEEACQQFEELFLNQMMSEMTKSSGKGMFGGGQQAQMYQGMLNQERAKSWSQEGGVGLANMLFQQMKDTL